MNIYKSYTKADVCVMRDYSSLLVMSNITSVKAPLCVLGGLCKLGKSVS